MKKPDFLNKLRQEGKLGLVEPSEEMKESYLIKADNCLKSAKILLKNNLYENSVAEAYYGMYNCLSALLYKVGIKCENHSAAIILLKKLFEARDLVKLISFAKEERIDKQYYVESKQRFGVTEKSCKAMVLKAEEFIIHMKLLIDRITGDDTGNIRAKFEDMFKP